jgi:predicted DNA-binding protein
MTKTKKPAVYVRLPPRLKAALEAECVRYGETEASIVRASIVEHLAASERARRMRSLGAGR